MFNFLIIIMKWHAAVSIRGYISRNAPKYCPAFSSLKHAIIELDLSHAKSEGFEDVKYVSCCTYISTHVYHIYIPKWEQE